MTSRALLALLAFGAVASAVATSSPTTAGASLRAGLTAYQLDLTGGASTWRRSSFRGVVGSGCEHRPREISRVGSRPGVGQPDAVAAPTAAELQAWLAELRRQLGPLVDRNETIANLDTSDDAELEGVSEWADVEAAIEAHGHRIAAIRAGRQDLARQHLEDGLRARGVPEELRAVIVNDMVAALEDGVRPQTVDEARETAAVIADLGGDEQRAAERFGRSLTFAEKAAVRMHKRGLPIPGPRAARQMAGHSPLARAREARTPQRKERRGSGRVAARAPGDPDGEPELAAVDHRRAP